MKNINGMETLEIVLTVLAALFALYLIVLMAAKLFIKSSRNTKPNYQELEVSYNSLNKSNHVVVMDKKDFENMIRQKLIQYESNVAFKPPTLAKTTIDKYISDHPEILKVT